MKIVQRFVPLYRAKSVDLKVKTQYNVLYVQVGSVYWKNFSLFKKIFCFYSSIIQTFRGAVRGVPTVLLPMDEQLTDARNSPQVYDTTLGYISGQTSWFLSSLSL